MQHKWEAFTGKLRRMTIDGSLVWSASGSVDANFVYWVELPGIEGARVQVSWDIASLAVGVALIISSGEIKVPLTEDRFKLAKVVWLQHEDMTSSAEKVRDMFLEVKSGHE